MISGLSLVHLKEEGALRIYYYFQRWSALTSPRRFVDVEAARVGATINRATRAYGPPPLPPPPPLFFTFLADNQATDVSLSLEHEHDDHRLTGLVVLDARQQFGSITTDYTPTRARYRQQKPQVGLLHASLDFCIEYILSIWFFFRSPIRSFVDTRVFVILL